MKDNPAHSAFDAGRVSLSSEEVPAAESEAHGTTIILHELRPEIRRLLQSVGIWQAQAELGPTGEPILPPPIYHIGCKRDDKRKLPHLDAKLPWQEDEDPSDRFRALVRVASEADRGSKRAPSLEQFDEYLKSIWKLSLALPLRYIDGHPFDVKGDAGILFLEVPPGNKRPEALRTGSGESIRDKLGLLSGKADSADVFDVLFDGVLLRRPIELPTHLSTPSRIGSPVMMVGAENAPFPESALDRAGGALRFEAYLYWNSKISPKDVQGSLIRVREASGTLFDHRFLDYQVSEQNRLRQITAEIFVLEGLDGAINIDRESFNYSHPHYIYIQKWLHRALRLLVNRLKLIANEDLERERNEGRQRTEHDVLRTAYSVWTSKRGAEADSPLPIASPTELPRAVKLKRSHCYSTRPTSGSEPSMCSLAFEFIPPPVALLDPFGVTRQSPSPGKAPSDPSLDMVAKTAAIDDLDALLDADADLSAALNSATHKLLSEIGYETHVIEPLIAPAVVGQTTPPYRFPDLE